MYRTIDYGGYVISVSAHFGGDGGWLGRYTISTKTTGETVYEVVSAAHRGSYDTACNAALILAADYVDDKLPPAPP